MYTEQTPCYSRVAAAALLAVSAGACFGVALSFTPAVSSLYAATAVRPVATTQVALNAPRAQMQAYNAQVAPEQYVPVQYEQIASQTSLASSWTILSGGLIAGAAAVAAILFRSSKAETSEQIAMLAASGKKAAPKKAVKAERELWYPTAVAPEWLDGSLPGDRGFDPFGLSKPTEYVQFDLDGLDQNAGKNRAGGIIGKANAQPDQLSSGNLAPYSEVFGLQRFRECELIHGRWAMLGVLGILVGESVTGVPWQNAGLVEVTSGASYFGYALPFTSSQVTWFEVLTMGFVEIYRNTELTTERRCYPGGAFDPLGLTSKDEETTFRLKEAELKHGRLAMIAFLGFASAALRTGEGATEGFANWASSFN